MVAKYSNKKDIVNIAKTLLSPVFSTIGLILILENFGYEKYGQYAGCLAVLNYSNLFSNSLNDTILNFSREINNKLFLYLILFLTMSKILFAYLLVILLIDYEYSIYVLLVSLLLMLQSFFVAFIQGRNERAYAANIVLFNALVFLIINILSISFELTISNWLVINICFLLIINFFLILKILKLNSKCEISTIDYKVLKDYSLPILVSNIFSINKNNLIPTLLNGTELFQLVSALELIKKIFITIQKNLSKLINLFYIKIKTDIDKYTKVLKFKYLFNFFITVGLTFLYFLIKDYLESNSNDINWLLLYIVFLVELNIYVFGLFYNMRLRMINKTKGLMHSSIIRFVISTPVIIILFFYVGPYEAITFKVFETLILVLALRYFYVKEVYNQKDI